MVEPGRRVLRVATLCLTLSLPLAGVAQMPVLRLGGAASGAVEGVLFDGAPSYPARALENLGFRVAAEPAAVSAVLGTDTLRFWATSPFFRAGARLHQLAFPVQFASGTAHVPEQFFIQWLPTSYPQRFAFRDGTLVVNGPVIAQSSAAQRESAAEAQRRRALAATRVVVLDAGHGGKDAGKIGPSGLKEKDVTLQLARRLATVLRERGYEVHLTRTTDTLIALADRAKLANKWKGERPGAVFLSLHANSAPSRSARGFETFFLSQARTDDERRVAEMENEAIQFEDQPAAPADEGLGQILNDMRSEFLMRASHDLAAVVQDKLAVFHPGPNRGVKRAGFYVLVGAIMPAALIETAFMSNREEAALLATQTFQQKLALGIADAVDDFFRKNEHLWSQGP